MNEEKKHLIVSIILGAAVLLTAVGAGFAIRMSFSKNRLQLPSSSGKAASVEVSSEAASSREAPSSRPVSSEREESSEREPVSSAAPPPSSEAASAPASSEEVSSEAPAFVDDSGATAVTFFAAGQTQALTPEQITEFMQLYLRVSATYIRSEDNTALNASGNGGFTIDYQDGRRESFSIGQPYDGIWWSGNDFYQVDSNAMNLEEYMCRFPLISSWVGRPQTPADPAESAEGGEGEDGVS